MNILVINAGSSSLKYQLINIKTEEVLAKGIAERIGEKNSRLWHKVQGYDDQIISVYLSSHQDAILLMIKAMVHPEYGVISSIKEISAIGHRVVHGGETFSDSVIIDDKVIKAIEKNIELAPLHNPANLMGITAFRKIAPNLPMVAAFDTAFHTTIPESAYLYAIPYEMYKEKNIRRYGFHGLSHRYVAQKAAEMLCTPIEKLKLVSCHLGNGASICAIDKGKSVDTSMGMTPLEGLMMGTRCGDLDPSIIEYIMSSYNYTINEVMKILNKESGFLGLSQLSMDNRDVTNAAKDGNKQCQAAIDLFEYRIKKYIGAYAAAMNGVDGIIFTGGIGENSQELRRNVCKGLSYLGLAFGEGRDENVDGDVFISHECSRVKAFRIGTNEELMIAQDVLRLI